VTVGRRRDCRPAAAAAVTLGRRRDCGEARRFARRTAHGYGADRARALACVAQPQRPGQLGHRLGRPDLQERRRKPTEADGSRRKPMEADGSRWKPMQRQCTDKHATLQGPGVRRDSQDPGRPRTRAPGDSDVRGTRRFSRRLPGPGPAPRVGERQGGRSPARPAWTPPARLPADGEPPPARRAAQLLRRVPCRAARLGRVAPHRGRAALVMGRRLARAQRPAGGRAGAGGRGRAFRPAGPGA
jgi:hypothetical protein